MTDDEIDALASRLYDALVEKDRETPEQSRRVLAVGYLIVHGMYTDDEPCRWCGQRLAEIGRTACQPCIDLGPGPDFQQWERELNP